MIGLVLTGLSLLERKSTASPKKPSTSQTASVLDRLLKDGKFNAKYDRRRGSWKIEGFDVELYDALLKVVVRQDIGPYEKGRVVFTGGVTYQAETGRTSVTITAGQTAWAIARYGNTLLVVDQRSDLLEKALL